MKQDSLVESVQVIPIQDLVAYRVIQEKTFEKFDVPFLRITTYKDGTIAIYPVKMQQIASEHILQQNEIDIYWDWLEYKGEPYGDNIGALLQSISNKGFLMAEIKTLNVIATILKSGPPKTALMIAQSTGIHIRSVYRYIHWIDDMSRTFEHKVERKVVNGSCYYHLRPFD